MAGARISIAVLATVPALTGCGADALAVDAEVRLRFVSSPVVSVDHNQEYRYTLEVANPSGHRIAYTVTAPGWLDFDSATTTLTGRAGWNNADLSFAVAIAAAAGPDTATQRYQLGVTRGEVACHEGFGSVMESPYVLPWAVGDSVRVSQGNCFAAGGHRQTFAYDFVMAIGDTVRAARAGTVIVVHENFADGDPVSGHENNVFVEHADGTVLRYTHLTRDGALVGVGESVTQGQAIGLSGNSGATGGLPHLHFALYRFRGNYTRKYSLPVNFRNARGATDSNGALLMNRTYEARPFTPDGR